MNLIWNSLTEIKSQSIAQTFSKPHDLILEKIEMFDPHPLVGIMWELRIMDIELNTDGELNSEMCLCCTSIRRFHSDLLFDMLME